MDAHTVRRVYRFRLEPTITQAQRLRQFTGPAAGCALGPCNSGWTTIGRRARRCRPKSSRPASPHSRISRRQRGCGRSMRNSCSRRWLI